LAIYPFNKRDILHKIAVIFNTLQERTFSLDNDPRHVGDLCRGELYTYLFHGRDTCQGAQHPVSMYKYPRERGYLSTCCQVCRWLLSNHQQTWQPPANQTDRNCDKCTRTPLKWSACLSDYQMSKLSDHGPTTCLFIAFTVLVAYYQGYINHHV